MSNELLSTAKGVRSARAKRKPALDEPVFFRSLRDYQVAYDARPQVQIGPPITIRLPRKSVSE